MLPKVFTAVGHPAHLGGRHQAKGGVGRISPGRRRGAPAHRPGPHRPCVGRSVRVVARGAGAVVSSVRPQWQIDLPAVGLVPVRRPQHGAVLLEVDVRDAVQEVPPLSWSHSSTYATASRMAV